jgi:hypothetical protein
MMILTNYINELLHRYDCVIVPNFGGFVTNRIGAKINQISHTFYPPTKQISFNSNLKHNDGLLANHIASSEKISFEKAVTAISLSVTDWNKDLQSKPVQLNNLGSFSLNTEKKIIFEPLNEVNYLTESFGLSNIENPVIDRPKQLIKPFVPVVKEKQITKIPNFIKYAATAAILLTLGFAVYSGSQENKQKEIIASQQKEFQKKIQTATFVISNPLPTINLNVVKEISKPYHIIAGAFQFPENAKKKMNQLKKKGFDSKIVGVNKWGLTQVSFSSFANRPEATNALYKIQDSISKGAWLLIKKVD